MGYRPVSSKEDQVIWYLRIAQAEIGRNSASFLPNGAFVFTIDEKRKLNIVGRIETCGTDDHLSLVSLRVVLWRLNYINFMLDTLRINETALGDFCRL